MRPVWERDSLLSHAWTPPASPAGDALPHESARGHVEGSALYTDDLRRLDGLLHLWPLLSPHARAKILTLDTQEAMAVPGVHAVISGHSVPGENRISHGEKTPLLPVDEVEYCGQPVAWVAAQTPEAAREAASRIRIEYEPLPPVLTIEEALAAGSFLTPPVTICRGRPQDLLEAVEHVISGEFVIGGQDHFYLETQTAWAIPEDDDHLLIYSSTQHPAETQERVAAVLGLPWHRVTVKCVRMGGAFGGKESQASPFAAICALAAWQTKRPCRLRLSRDHDMVITGKRHPFLARYQIGFDARGVVQAFVVTLFADGGYCLDLSAAVLSRALLHVDNAYYIPHLSVTGRVVKTNKASNTAFRGFGGPQGMLVIEDALARVARYLGLPPEEVRARNFYRGDGESNTTHYGQEIRGNRIQRVWQEAKSSSRFEERRGEIQRWNRAHAHRKRGIAITPVKFGIAFTQKTLNQAGALVHIFRDGSVQVNHGGAEMGQGIHTKMRQVAAAVLGIPLDQVRVMPTSTDKVPNTSPSAASSTADLNGEAVRLACQTLRERLALVAAPLMGVRTWQEVAFAGGMLYDVQHPDRRLPFTQAVQAAYEARVSLSATGHYSTPGLHFDPAKGHGRPFHYFAFGAAVAEVEVDGFTGAFGLRRVDIVHDAGASLNPLIDTGQVEGGFVQGMGWLTSEELVWNDAGELLTHAPSTYKIPAITDVPASFHVRLLPQAAQPGVVFGSKAVGEPPLMLAFSVREAIRDAVANFALDPSRAVITLASPATPARILQAIQEVRHQDLARAPKEALHPREPQGA